MVVICVSSPSCYCQITQNEFLQVSFICFFWYCFFFVFKVFLESLVQKFFSDCLLILLHYILSLFAILAQVYHNITCLKVRGFATEKILKLNLLQPIDFFCSTNTHCRVPTDLEKQNGLVG